MVNLFMIDAGRMRACPGTPLNQVWRQIRGAIFCRRLPRHRPFGQVNFARHEIPKKE
jgi:hypothetical protein